MWSMVYISFFATTVFCSTHDRNADINIMSDPNLEVTEETLSAPARYESKLPDSKYKGFVLIINIHRVRGVEERHGSEADVANLWNTFVSLNYKADVEDDSERPLTRDRLLKAVHKFAHDPLKHYFGKVVVVIMSHSDDSDQLITSDCDRVRLSEVKMELASSPLLNEKAKLLFVLACQGGDRNIIQKICQSPPADCQGNFCTRISKWLRRQHSRPVVTTPGPVPEAGYPDMAIILSSQPAEASYNHKYLGSSFVSIVCSELRNSGRVSDVETLLNGVSNRMPKKGTDDINTDVCHVESTLVGKAFLFN